MTINPFDNSFANPKIEVQQDENTCPICGTSLKSNDNICPKCNEIVKDDDFANEWDTENENDITISHNQQQRKETLIKTKPTLSPIVEWTIWGISAGLILSLFSIIAVIAENYDFIETNLIIGYIIYGAILFAVGITAIVKLKNDKCGNMLWTYIYLICIIVDNIISLIILSISNSFSSPGGILVSLIIAIILLVYIITSNELTSYNFRSSKKFINVIWWICGFISIAFVLSFDLYLLFEIV